MIRNLQALADLQNNVQSFRGPKAHGRLTRLVGPMARTNLTSVRMGDLVALMRDDTVLTYAEVAGFEGGETLLTILGETHALDLSVRVVSQGAPLQVPVSNALCGRVVDSIGQPVDGLGPLKDVDHLAPVRRTPPDAMSRPLIDTVLSTGLRAIDGVLTLGAGQRVGLFGSPGAGKSTLLAQIASQTKADVCVLCLVGERGRELREFLDRALPKEHRQRTVVVVETSDKPAGLRIMAGHTGMAIAEYFRDQGQSVLFMFDSVTRYARALREVGIALGMPPARRGFTPNVFEELPRLFERAGRTDKGTITAVFTTLSEGDGTDDPIVEEVQSLLDGHIYLSDDLARKGHYPAIDILRSKSRLMNELATPQQIAAAEQLRVSLSALDEVAFLLKVGEYKAGGDPVVDKALKSRDAIDRFLRQPVGEASSLTQTNQQLDAIQ